MICIGIFTCICTCTSTCVCICISSPSGRCVHACCAASLAVVTACARPLCAEHFEMCRLSGIGVPGQWVGVCGYRRANLASPATIGAPATKEPCTCGPVLERWALVPVCVVTCVTVCLFVSHVTVCLFVSCACARCSHCTARRRCRLRLQAFEDTGLGPSLLCHLCL